MDNIQTFNKLSNILTQSNQKTEIPNIDFLIQRPCLYSYIPKRNEDDFESKGLLSPLQLIKNYPEHEEYYKALYKDVLTNPILSNSVFCFFSRIPIDLENTMDYIGTHTPVKIQLGKLKKCDTKFRIYGYNFPDHERELIKLSTEDIAKLLEVEDVWYKYFENSKDSRFRDFPCAVIHSDSGIIPAFCCKIQDDKKMDR